MTSVGHEVAPIWPATGLSIWLVIRFGPRVGIAMALGEFAANLLDEVPVSGISETIQVSTMALGNILTAFAGAALWRRSQLRWAGKLGEFCEPASAAAASFAAPLIAAFLGVGALHFTAEKNLASPAGNLLAWWTSDAIGSLFLLPFLLSMPALDRQLRRSTPRDFLRGLLLLATCGAASWLIFAQPGGSRYLFALFPLLLLATLWFDAPGARLATLIMASTGIIASVRGHGPFATGLNGQGMITVQLFLSIIGLVGLILPVLHAGKNLTRRGTVILLLTGWVLAGSLFALLQYEQDRENAANFSSLTSNAGLDIQTRVTEYVDVGRGGAGFLSGSRAIDRAAWATYIQALDLSRRYPSLIGLGVVYPVPVAQTENFLQRIRADTAPNFKIHPVPAGKALPDHEQYVMTYLEPNAETHAAVGLDLATEEIRRTAADLARDTGEPQLSNQILLFGEPEKRTGFLLFVPVYRSNLPTKTVEERRAALRAWIVAPFFTEPFLQSALGRRATIVQLSIFSGDRPDPAHLLVTTEPPGAEQNQYERIVSRRIFGRPITLGWNRGPAFVPASRSLLLWLGTSFALAVVLLTGWVLSLETFRERAEALATERTAALRQSEARYRSLSEASTAGIWQINNAGETEYINHAMCDMLEIGHPEEISGQTYHRFFTPASLELMRTHHAKQADHQSSSDEVELLGQRGGHYTVLLSGAPLLDAEGALRGLVGTFTNITARKKTEAALQESEARYRRIVQTAEEGIWTIDAEARTSFVNPKMTQLLGYTFDEMMGRPLAEFMDAGGQALAEKNIERRKQGIAEEHEFKFLRRDQTELYCLLVTSPVFDVKGNYAGALAMVTDITERRRSEIQLRETEQRFRDLVDSTDGIVWEADAATFIFNSVSNNAERLLGYPVTDWLQPGFWANHIHPDDRDYAVQYCADCTKKRENHDFEYRFLAQGGRIVWLRDIVKIIEADGKPRWLRGLMVDITTQKETAQALQLEQEKAERYLEVAEVILVAFDTEARVTLLNRKGHEVLGYEIGELVGRNWFELCLPSDEREAVLKTYHRILSGDLEPVEYYENHVVRKDGTKRLIGWNNSMLRDDAGNISGTFSSGEDITEKKIAQDAIRASLREKEALLKEVHHRVKNNLQVITSLLRLEAGRSAHPATKSVLGDMQARIRSMAMLHESLYRSGTFAAIDLSAYLRQLTTHSVRAHASTPGAIQFHHDLASVNVEMDQALPCGLLVNELISNCFKHGFPGGRTGEIHIGLQPLPGGAQWGLRVSDNGVGLPLDFDARRGLSLGLQLVADLAATA